MPINAREAQRLSTASEWTLVASSLRAGITSISDAQLKRGMARARTLRDKYRDLSRRQHRQVQPRRSGRPDEALNVRTKQKALLFAEVLERFTVETRQRVARASAKRPTGSARRPTAAKKQPKKTRAAAVPARPIPPTPPPAKVKQTRAPLVPKAVVVAARTGQHRIHAHVSSAARRQQGRRDRR